jgi:ribosomal protein L11 methyltransferase
VASSSPALVIRFPSGTTAPLRDRLVALLAGFDLLAVQEDDLDLPRAWSAHFATRASRDAAAAAIADDDEFALVGVERTEVEDENWAQRTQADLPAITIGRVTIAPPWDLPRPGLSQLLPSAAPRTPSPVVVQIEPSRGFGTGHHQSTRLCIVLLQSRDLQDLTMVDVGTGSGVLAITAAKLGAAFVAAIDSDPEAVDNARENIAANGVEAIVDAHVDDLATTTVPAADLVTANLTATLLSRHASDLGRLVRPSGSLIVSGFNLDDRDRVVEAFAPHFEVTEAAEEDDWMGLVLGRGRP